MSSHPLWPRMNRILNQFELCSSTSAQNLEPSRGGKSGSRAPAQQSSERDHWLRKWNEAPDHKREGVVEDAEFALEQLTHSQAPATAPKPESVEERTARILHHNNEGVEPAQLAVALYGFITVQMIRKARTDAGLDPLTGRAWKEREDQAARARRLMGSGMSLRQTATVLGLHMEQLRRVLAKDAA